MAFGIFILPLERRQILGANVHMSWKQVQHPDPRPGMPLTLAFEFDVVTLGVAANPNGPYTYKAQLAPTNNAWAIDGTVLTNSGSNYFFSSRISVLITCRVFISRMTNAYTVERDVINF
ncbi:hypothetical protein BJ912DRAFT_595268 [Pholiota molesta]|nr:hypothetical protein BJ912DRAFT_595268 [Pholiota molesta]